MANMLELSVSARKETGKPHLSGLRAEGFVPGIFYNAKGENIAVKVKELPLEKLYRKIGNAHVFQLKIESDGAVEEKPSFIWELKHHPVKKRIMHVDFYGVDLSKKIKVEIPVKVEGKAPGVVEGGVLELFREMVEIECLPLSIPESISADVSGLGINQNVMISELKAPEGVSIVFDENFAVVGVLPPVSEAAEEAEGAAPAAEGAATPAA
jgi:large subunit ribosomal protein L25